MFPPQFQHHRFDLLGRAVAGLMRRPAAIAQTFQPFAAVAPPPHISGLARDPVATAQLRHAVQTALVLQDKPRPLLTLLAFQGMLLFYIPRCSVSYLPGLFCQVSLRSVPPPTQANGWLEGATRRGLDRAPFRIEQDAAIPLRNKGTSPTFLLASTSKFG